MEGISNRLKTLREQQAHYANRNTVKAENLQPGDRVRMKMSHRNWSGGNIIKHHENNPRSVVVQLDDGRTFRRNTSQIHKTNAKLPEAERIIVPQTADNHPPLEANPTNTELQESGQSPNISQKRGNSEQKINEKPTMISTPLQKSTRSGRIVKPPSRLNL